VNKVRKYILTDLLSKEDAEDYYVCHLPKRDGSEDVGVGWSEDIEKAVSFNTYAEASEAAELYDLLQVIIVEEFWDNK
jgi:hypothetical protein